MAARDGACAQGELAVLDLRRGTVTGKATTPTAMTRDTVAQELYLSGLGDWNGDGRPDLLQVQTEFHGAVVDNGAIALNDNNTVGQPSGHVLASSSHEWHSYVNILSSTGRMLLREDLGLGHGAAPTARWAPNGRDIVLALPRGTSTEISLRTNHGRGWSQTIIGSVSDVALFPHAGGVVVAASLASAEWHAHMVQLVGIDRRGQPAWTQRRMGSRDLLQTGRDLFVVDCVAGLVERLDLATGAVAWQATVAGPAEGFVPKVVGDLNGGRAPDLLLSGLITATAIAGETGSALFTYPVLQTFGVSDLDGTRGDDLVTVEAADGSGETITLRRGLDGRVVWTRPLKLGIENQDTYTAASRGGSAPMLVLADVDGMVTSLQPRTGMELWHAKT